MISNGSIFPGNVLIIHNKSLKSFYCRFHSFSKSIFHVNFSKVGFEKKYIYDLKLKLKIFTYSSVKIVDYYLKNLTY